MPERLPFINDLPDVVQAGIGENVYVTIIRDDPSLGRVQSSVYEMIDDVIDDVMIRTHMPHDRSIERLCVAVSRVAVGRLVSSKGLYVYYGGRDNPREVSKIILRPDQVPVNAIEAEIERPAEA